MELEELDNLTPAVVIAAARVMAKKCLVERDIILRSMCLEVIKHPDRVRELLQASPQFGRELMRQRGMYDRLRMRQQQMFGL